MTDTVRDIESIRREMRAAQDAWQAAIEANTTGGNTSEIIALATAESKLRAEYHMAKLGKFRAVENPCKRCGGYGGSSGWPGFVCFDCNGSGTEG